MGPDAANLASSIQRSLEVDRSPSATQRASEISQGLFAAESTAALSRKKTDAAVQINREKIRREHEKRRRELERHGALKSADDDSEDGGSALDVVV